MRKSKLTNEEENLIKSIRSYKSTYPHVLILIVVVLFIIVILIPISIWVSFFIGDIIKGIPTRFNAGDVLEYNGSILVFIGTVFLSVLALCQNKKFKKENVKLENKQIAIEHMPILLFNDNIEYTYYNESPLDQDAITQKSIPAYKFNGDKMIWHTNTCDSKKTLQLRLHFKNIGTGIAENIIVRKEDGEKAEESNVLDSNKNGTKYILLGQDGIVLINIYLATLFNGKEIKFLVSFCNPFGSQYHQTISIKMQHSMIIITTLVKVNIESKE